LPFQGRKHYKGLLVALPEGGEGWRLEFNDGKTDQALDFTLDEVREARLVPVVDFKGRRFAAPAEAVAENEQPADDGANGDRKE